MTDTMTVDEIVEELRDMLEVTRATPSLVHRLAGKSLTVLYEFCASGPDGSGSVVSPHVMHVGSQERYVEARAVPYAAADIVIRAEPVTLHRLTSGELNGREAIVSGMLDIRKAPSMPKLLMMRGLFNQYKKAQARRTATADDVDARLSAGSGENCAVETAAATRTGL